ncbi:MAG TPA: C25 family cysteine peptidase [Rudaea sp.]|nr:C25 family cysteine peptidase [Rudaea sp.]
MSIPFVFVARGLRVTLGALLLAPLTVFACSGRVHIELKDSGVYALGYAAIVAAQPQLADCRAAELVLWHKNAEVPIRIVGAKDGYFVSGASVQWLGQMLHGPESWFDPYSNVNVYQLGAGTGAHARLKEIPAPAAADRAAGLRRRLHFERENLMIRLGSEQMKPGEEPDVFQWSKLTPIDPKPFSFGFDLPDADLHGAGRRGASVPLTLDFRGESNVLAPPKGQAKASDHVVDVAINGKPVQALQWDGRGEIRRTLLLPGNLFKATDNTLTLSVPRRADPRDAQNFIIDVVMFNWAEVSYPIRGDMDASTAAFSAVATAPIELASAAPAAELFGNDGTLREGLSIGKKRFRFAGASEEVDLYPSAGKALAPTLVRAVASGDLRAADPGFDYLIVAHPRLLGAIQRLAAYHRLHGLRVEVADVDAIYDQFNGGIAHPDAIRDYVAWGWQHWKSKPKYLLLVGDASFDIHHDLRSDRPNATMYALRPDPLQNELLQPGGLSSMPTSAYSHWDPALPNRNLIPTFQYAAPEGQGASDNGFVAVKPGSNLPQLAVGRFPVVEPAEVGAIVDKTIAYLEHRNAGAWQRDVTLISTSEVASFKGDSDKIAADLERRGFVVDNVYTAFEEKDAARYQDARKILKHDLDKGNVLVHFLGHGGQFIWRVGPIGDLFTLADVDALSNAGKYPMVLSMTCFSAPFDHPTEDSIGERFLRDPGKGAIAFFGASWMNWPDPVNSRFMIERLLTPGETIGDAIVAVKHKATDPVFVQMYNLLGDPAVALSLPRRALQMDVDRERWEMRVNVRIPASDFGGHVDVDWLDKNGDRLASARYEARDTQFSLTPPDKAVRVQVYAADTRNGLAAFGSADLTPLPSPVVKRKPEPALHFVPRPRTPPAPDTIKRGSFDGD